jgi:hypothetical protein
LERKNKYQKNIIFVGKKTRGAVHPSLFITKNILVIKTHEIPSLPTMGQSFLTKEALRITKNEKTQLHHASMISNNAG